MHFRTLTFAPLLFLFISHPVHVLAQDEEKVTIAILPFVTSANVVNGYKDAVQETVTKEFVSKSRFSIVDRSKFESVIKELNIQKNEEFLNSKVVDQGKLLGAQYLITGVIAELKVNHDSKGVPIDPSKPLGPRTTVTTYRGVINFSYQVIDVATSQAVYSENINVVGNEITNANEGEAISNALCKLKSPVKQAVLKQFPPEILIVQVEKSSKKGLPEKVLISAGNNLFDEDKAGGCGGIDLNVSSLFKKKGTWLKVCMVENITINGRESKREKNIGKLKLDDVQGDVSVCDVADGAKEIQDGLNEKKKLLIRVL